jgi:hypothetical protein
MWENALPEATVLEHEHGVWDCCDIKLKLSAGAGVGFGV